jgi:hypothetical protein
MPAINEVAWLRERIVKLVHVDVAQLDPTKLTQYKKGEFFGPHIDTHGTAFGSVKLTRWIQLVDLGLHTEVAQTRFKETFDEPISVGQTPDRNCSVFIYLNDVAQGGQTIFSKCGEEDDLLGDITDAFDALRCEDAASAAASVAKPRRAGPLAIKPHAGMAVVHFPATAAKYGRDIGHPN